MTIVSRGYEGQIMPNVEWAEWQQGAGHEYVASHYDAGRVTVVTSTPLMVRVNVGPTVDGLRAGIGGHGVYDIITAAEDITISAALPGAGQSKWYTIVARRTWQTTQATTFAALTGTATQAIAASRQKTPGTVDEQPLALVQVTNGTSGLSITAVIDLRPVSRQQGGYVVAETAARDLVMSYMNKVGYRLRVGSAVWERTIASGVASWVLAANSSPWSSAGIIYGSGFLPYTGSSWPGVVYSVVNGICYVTGAIKRGVDATGSWTAGEIPLNIPEGFRPTVKTSGVNAQIDTSGQVYLSRAGSGALDINLSYPLP